jgi:hypothetical protein
MDVDRMVKLVEKYADFPLGAVDASVIAIAERSKEFLLCPRGRAVDGHRRVRALAIYEMVSMPSWSGCGWTPYRKDGGVDLRV